MTLFINTESPLSFPLHPLQHAFVIMVDYLRTAAYPKILTDVRTGNKVGKKREEAKNLRFMALSACLCSYAFFSLPTAFCQIKISSESAIVLKCLKQFISLSQLILVLVIKQKVNTFSLALIIYTNHS